MLFARDRVFKSGNEKRKENGPIMQEGVRQRRSRGLLMNRMESILRIVVGLIKKVLSTQTATLKGKLKSNILQSVLS